MGLMATVTLTVDYRFVGICFHKLYFGIKMTSVTSCGHLIFQHASKIRAVGIVTTTTLTLRKRFMRLTGLQSLLSLLVT